MLQKEKIQKFDNTYYLLGQDADGEKYYLEKGKFECDWYWSGGYLEVFDKGYSDIKLHTHYNWAKINNHKVRDISEFKYAFPETVLNKKETYTFHELMHSFYTAKDAMDMAYLGGSHITQNPLRDTIKNPEVYEHYYEVIDKIHQQLDILLSPKTKESEVK